MRSRGCRASPDRLGPWTIPYRAWRLRAKLTSELIVTRATAEPNAPLTPRFWAAIDGASNVRDIDEIELLTVTKDGDAPRWISLCAKIGITLP